MSRKLIFPAVCAGLLLTAPAIAAPKPAAPPSHATAAADNTSAVAAVSRMLTLRAKNNFAGMYDLLSASSKKNIPRKEFLAVSIVSKAEVAQMPSDLRGMYALFADTRNVLGYTFAVVGPDPANPDIVLVHAFPKPAPGVVSETLKVYTVADRGTGKTPRRTVDAFGSVGRAMLKAQSEQAVPPTDTPPPADVPPTDTPAAPPTDTPPAIAPAQP